MPENKAVNVGAHRKVQSAESAANANPPKDPFERYNLSKEDPFADDVKAAKAERRASAPVEPPKAQAPARAPEPQKPAAPAPSSGGNG